MRLAWCLLVPVLVGAALLAACDSGGGMDGANGGDGDENSAPSASATANATDVVVGDTVRLDASESSDPDGDNLSYNWTLDRPASSDATLSSPTAVDPWFVPDTASSDGGYTAEVEVVEDTEEELSDTDDVSITAKKQLPETVTVNFENRAADGDSLIAGTLKLAGEVVSEADGKASGSFTAASSRETKQLCFTENDLFSQYCETVSLTGDIAVELRPDRKTVEFTVIPDPPYGSPAETKVTVYEPFMADSTKFVGEKTVERPKRSDGLTRKVKTDLKTDDPDKDGRLDRLVADTTVTANSDVELYAQSSLVPACSDGINSDQDPFVKDTNDPGCAQQNGFGYNPDDDNEIHGFFSRTSGIYFDDSTHVSSTEGERVAQIREANNPLPQSVTVAVGEITVIIETKPLGGGFAIHIKSGDDNDNLTVAKTSDVVFPDSTNEWGTTEVYGIDRTFFADGPHYAVYAWDSTKANGEPPFNSDKLVIFYEGLQNARGHIIEYYFEPDHPNLQNGSSSAKAAGISQDQLTALDNGECIQVSDTDTVCENGVPEGF